MVGSLGGQKPLICKGLAATEPNFAISIIPVKFSVFLSNLWTINKFYLFLDFPLYCPNERNYIIYIDI